MNILSIDLEDWFHILGHPANNAPAQWNGFESNFVGSVHSLLQLLQKTDQHATFFCLGWIADKYPHLIRQINDSGYEIGSHTYYHRRISEYSIKSFNRDVERSIKSIEDITGNKVTSFRFPGFQINTDYLWALEILNELGIESDSSVQISYRNTRMKSYPARIMVNEKGIKEFPIPVYFFMGNTFFRSGSGYFRLFPYAWTKSFLLKNNYNMVYFHPRDIYPAPDHQGRFNRVRKFKSHKGIQRAGVKLEQLLADFHFTSLRKASETFNWKESRIFHYVS